MKVLCPACERLIELEVFRLERDALVVSCGKCGAQTRVVASAPVALSAGAEATPAPVKTQPPPAPRPSVPSAPPAQPSMPRVALVSSPTASNVVALKTAATEAIERAAARADHPFEVPSSVCPKCVAPRGPGAACPQCGLTYVAYRPDGAVPQWLAEDWVGLLRDWGNDERHERLRKFASQQGALAEVGRLYRLQQVFCPEDPWAASAREDILSLAATVALRPTPQSMPLSDNPRLKMALVGLLVLITLGGLGYLLSVLRRL